MKKLLLILVLVFSLNSCITPYQPPSTYNFVNERTYNLNYETTWSKVLSFFSEMGTTIKHLDKNAGFINSDFTISAYNVDSYADCGVAAKSQYVHK